MNMEYSIKKDVWEIVQDAYIYTFPLMMTHATALLVTNTVDATENKAPVNQLCHARSLVDYTMRTVVTPNADTVYSQCHFDLSRGPQVFTKPAADRFLSVQIMDAYTNTAAVMGTGGDTQAAASYLIAGPGYHGPVPEGLILIQVPTNNAWMIVRTMVASEDDLPEVHKLQQDITMLPLAEYGNPSYHMPEGEYNPAYDFVPVDYVCGLSLEEYFAEANRLLAFNPPPQSDAGILAELAGIGVGPGLALNAVLLGDSVGEQWAGMHNRIEDVLLGSTQNFVRRMGTWHCYKDPIGDFGEEYAFRALVAREGLGANPTYVAIYPKADRDSDGFQLTGEKKYRLHFDKDNLPPTEEYGFWSVTAYGQNNFLIQNELGRYLINDRSGVQYNEDGSLDILLQAQRPQDEALLGNWLPVCPEDFHLFLRIYMPTKAALDNSWKAPVINKVK